MDTSSMNILPFKIHRWSGLSPEEREALLARPVLEDSDKESAVQAIIDRVRKEGDTAVRELTAKFDGFEPEVLKVPAEQLESAKTTVEPEILEAIEHAGDRIHAFHSVDIPLSKTIETAAGLICSVRYQPLSPVGLYIPGGSAPLISTILMLAIPARLAGCNKVVLCTPPGRDGNIPAEMLAAADRCGVKHIYSVGGAQAIAAMAYGTETIPRCNKILGPGNSWVTMAKQLVSRDPQGCAIDMPAGPSEVLVIADNRANAEFTAWDLLSQAEHGPDSQVILLTDDEKFANDVAHHLEEIAPQLPRAEILRQSLREARLIVVDSLDLAMEISDQYAPEHLILNTDGAPAMAEKVRNAGSVFVGRWTPESLGDYCSGTNHVLPTNGWAKSYGALGVTDFMRRMTLQESSRDALASVGSTACTLASVEGLEAHRMAIRCRLRDLES
jgi:histidinol dehydrogenase